MPAGVGVRSDKSEYMIAPPKPCVECELLLSQLVLSSAETTVLISILNLSIVGAVQDLCL